MQLTMDNNYYNDLAIKAVDDIEVFNELYDYYFPRVYNFLFARLKDTTSTDDVISEVFIKVFNNLSKYNGQRGSFSTWLFRIAINQSTDYLRKIQNRKENTWEDFFDPAIPHHEEPEAKLLINERKQELLKAMENLKERDRYILELKYWSDLSNKEIADIMDISPANVGIILFRAIGSLKKFMNEA